ncbi:MAG: T9SS type A sorting domain-containing protein [Bacteroidetes bacterium]|nr:T9SS type A sorting domain-containing protein [Bacteroidota bacterium]
MKKSTLLFSCLIFSCFVSISLFAQESNRLPDVDVDKNLDVCLTNPDATANSNVYRGAWDLQFNFTGIDENGTAGCETDGSFFYVTDWNGSDIFKHDLSGNLVETFSIPTVSGIRDLAYDGTYFYGGTTGNVIYQMDFSAKTLVSTISSPSEKVRNICYDPVADAFWVGNWATNLSLVDRTGSVIRTINSNDHGMTSTYGTAYDTITPGGPFIWGISAASSVNTTITQINATTGKPTGITHDCTTDICNPGELGGGLWIHPNIVAGTATLGGVIQNNSIFGYKLSSVIPDSFDLAVMSIDLASFIPVTTPVNIKGVFTNNGLVTINSLDLSYSIDGGTAVVEHLTGLNIPSFQPYNYSHSTAWTPTLGAHDIEVSVSDPNGVQDQYTANDKQTISTTVYDPIETVQRLPLLEVFTSSTCGPCRPGNENLHAIMDGNPGKGTVIKYQQNFPGSGDPYGTTEAVNRRGYYSITSIPRMEIDGGWDGNAQSFSQQLLDEAYAIPSFLDITATHTINWHTVNIQITLNPLTDNSSNNLRLHIAILEKATYANVKSNGETEFLMVMKKMIPNQNGSSQSPLVAGIPVNISKSYTFNGNYRLPNSYNDQINHNTEYSVEEFNDLTVLVWLQDENTMEVFQSAYSTGTVLGLNNPAPGNGIISMYPNPVNNDAHLNFLLSQDKNVQIAVYDALGNTVYQEDKGLVQSGPNSCILDFNNLTRGVYVLRLALGEQVYTRKFIVQ